MPSTFVLVANEDGRSLRPGCREPSQKAVSALRASILHSLRSPFACALRLLEGSELCSSLILGMSSHRWLVEQRRACTGALSACPKRYTGPVNPQGKVHRPPITRSLPLVVLRLQVTPLRLALKAPVLAGQYGEKDTQRSMFNHNTNNKETDMNTQANHEQQQKQEPAQGASSKACFTLGATVATPAAIAVLEENGVSFISLLARHVRGDWGRVCPEDAEANVQALLHGSRIMSVYPIGNACVDVWVITEADRSATTILLPSDY